VLFPPTSRAKTPEILKYNTPKELSGMKVELGKIE